ncbi:MAG: phosphoribosylformylglycinamidine synthase subunit PurL, partial [Candidatus Aminicenantes bacterium]|nr:phosphoribosylformylglycinamidine synthase subunit PurL [Candidatus Aminicenantes bacterium]
MTDPKVLSQHNLTPEEYDLIVRLVGREPNLTEIGIFSAMWSEHCSYKSSKIHLQKLPTRGKNVVQGPGENAGIIDIGDGRVVVFKIESHNHPSFIEPFQGAATGVGGILRDIFTMGARPVALMDSLRFGPLENPKNRSIMDGVVAGISSYGNSIGVPTVGGEVYFGEGYSLNPLVNVFCLGLADRDKIFFARTEDVGNAILYVGTKTGRDGIHGASMASQEFGEDTEHKRPNVQVGDPFKEKLLLEACLEVMGRNLIVGIQDMGAAGLTCSTTEMPAKSGQGVEIDLDLVPQRESGMTPYEIMLSESQERMLIACKPERVRDVQQAFAKWDLDAVAIGRVTEDGQLRCRFRGEIVVDVPVSAVVDLCPMYDRPVRESPAAASPAVPKEIPLPADLEAAFRKVLSSPTVANKEWVYRQYDHMVLTNTALLPGAGAAVLRVKGSKKGLAMTLDGNSLYARLDPRTGGKIAVAEACRNLACVGARPVGVTNCLNFGNPEKPAVMGQFKEVVEGLGEACRTFEVAVTGGNVSFYNDTEGASIDPTPVLGVVGLIDDLAKAVTPGFKGEGEAVILLGETLDELGGTEYLKTVHGLEAGPPPAIDLGREKAVQEACLEAIGMGLVRSAHDPSEGGLAVCAAECAFHGPGGVGVVIELPETLRPDVLLFGESQSRILLTAKPEDASKVLDLAEKRGVPAAVIGLTGGSVLKFTRNGRTLMALAVAEARGLWMNALPDYFRVRQEAN